MTYNDPFSQGIQSGNQQQRQPLPAPSINPIDPSLLPSADQLLPALPPSSKTPVINVGPRPLGIGEAPVPTRMEYIEGQTQIYNGQPIINPDGSTTNNPAFGMVRINTVRVYDQGDNIMGPGTGVEVTERITPTSPDAVAEGISSSGNTPMNINAQGEGYDRVGVSYTTPAARDAQFAKPFDVQFNQTIRVGMAGQRGSFLRIDNTHRVTNKGKKGITSTIGEVRQYPRPR